MFLCAESTELQSKENFDTNPDPNEALVIFFISKYRMLHLVNN